jgi:hypothetical protein
MHADHSVRDLVADRVVRITGVLEDVDEGPDAGVTDQGRPSGDRNLHRQPMEGRANGDGARVPVDRRRRLLVGCVEVIVIDLPLSATKTCQKVPAKNVPFAVSRRTDVP